MLQELLESILALDSRRVVTVPDEELDDLQTQVLDGLVQGRVRQQQLDALLPGGLRVSQLLKVDERLPLILGRRRIDELR